MKYIKLIEHGSPTIVYLRNGMALSLSANDIYVHADTTPDDGTDWGEGDASFDYPFSLKRIKGKLITRACSYARGWDVMYMKTTTGKRVRIFIDDTRVLVCDGTSGTPSLREFNLKEIGNAKNFTWKIPDAAKKEWCRDG